MASIAESRSNSPTYSHLLYPPRPNMQRSTSSSSVGSSRSPTCSHLSYPPRPTMQRSTSSSTVASSRSANSNHSICSQSTASTCGTSTISISSPRYADDHYPLIHTTHPETVPASVPGDHSAFWCARQMAQIHNTIIRALNASWNHAALVQPDTVQAADFLFFNQQLFTMLDHHHKVEDDFLFAEIERMLDQPRAMEVNTKAHESFAEGLTIFEKYVFHTKPAEFNGVTLQHIIESFAPGLIQHLHEEIPALVNLHVLDSAALLKVWKEAGRRATKDADLYTSAPWTLGCQDKSFTIDAEKPDFPHMPWVVEAAVKTWHGKRYTGAWKFCPSDLSGRRRLVTVL